MTTACPRREGIKVPALERERGASNEHRERSRLRKDIPRNTSQGTSNQEGSKSVFSGSGMSQERQLAQKQLDLRQSRTKKIRSNENRTKKQLTAIDGENPPRKRDLAKVDSASGSPEKMNRKRLFSAGKSSSSILCHGWKKIRI